MFSRIVLFFAVRHNSLQKKLRTSQVSLRSIDSFLASREAVEALIANSAVSDADRNRIMRQAKMVFSNAFSFRGIGRINLPLQEGCWYSFPLDEHTLSAADVRMINRHDFLLPLAQSTFLEDMPDSVSKIYEFFNYWIENFDVFALLKNDTPIDAAIRLINWMWVLSFGLLTLSGHQRIRLNEIIRLQVEYISAWRSPGGNHLVLEALATYIIARAFPDLDGASRWRKWSLATLIRELDRQIADDGIHTEQSMFYHQAVATHFLKFKLTAEATKDKLPDRAMDKLGLMLDYIYVTMKPDSTHPMLGDGELMVTDDREHWEAKCLLAARSHFFGRPLYTKFVPSINDASVWLLGLDPRNISVTPEPPESVVFESTGAAVFRDDSRFLYFDGAPFGDPDLPHHGHADALSIEFFANSSNIFIDPGGYGYYDDDFRKYFRGTSAHNTIVIDDRSQSALYGVIGFGKIAHVEMLRHELSNELDYVAGTHNGYHPTTHLREIFFRKGAMKYLLIIDHLSGSGIHKGASLFHMPPDVNLDKETGDLRAEANDFLMQVAAVSNVTLEQDVNRGRKYPSLQGWTSPQTKVAVPSNTWQINFTFTGSAYVAILMATKEEMPRLDHQVVSSKLTVHGKRKDCYDLASPIEPYTRYLLNS
jgi:hypothetical protein